MVQNTNGILEELSKNILKIIGDDLVGIYLHGSLAMGCYNPKSSDIDFVIIVRNHLNPNNKKSLIEYLVKIEQGTMDVHFEMSMIKEQDLHPCKHPMNFLLHYSKQHKKAFIESGSMCQNSIDPDLIAHIAMIKEGGLWYQMHLSGRKKELLSRIIQVYTGEEETLVIEEEQIKKLFILLSEQIANCQVMYR